MGKRKAERTEGAAPPKRSLRSRKPKTAGDEHGTPTGNHQEAALIQSQDSDKTDSNSQNALVSELVQQGHADPSDSITNKDPSKPDCSGPGETIPTCGEDSDRINSKSHNALWGPTEEEGVRGQENTDTGPPKAQGNKTPVCEPADPDPECTAESAQLVHPPSTMATNKLVHPPSTMATNQLVHPTSTMETGPLAHPISTMATGQLVHPSSSVENISQAKVRDHHTATPTHPSKQPEDTEASGGGDCHDMEAQGGSGYLSLSEVGEVKLGESLSLHALEVGEEEETSHRPLKEEEEGGVTAGPQAEAETKMVPTEEEKMEGADISTTMKEGEEEEEEEEQALLKREEDVVASTSEAREDEEERRSGDRGEEDAPQVEKEEDDTSQKQKDEKKETFQKQKDEDDASEKKREEEETSVKKKDEDEASQNQRVSAKDEEESSQGGDDGAAVATHRLPKRKRMGMGVRRRMGMGRPCEREKKAPMDGQTSEKEKKTPTDGETSERERKTPTDGETSEKEKEKRTLVEAQTSANGRRSGEGGENGDERMDMGRPSDKERQTPTDGETSKKERKTPADGEMSGRRTVGGEGGGGGGRGVNEDEGGVERERKCGMSVEERNSVSEMEGARGEMEREKDEGMMETERNSIAEMDEGGREMVREKSEGAREEEKNVVGEMEKEKNKRVTENDRQVVVAEQERAVPLATAPSDVPSEVVEEQQYERRDNGNPGDKEQAAMTTDDGSRMLVHSAEVRDELDHNFTDAREEQRTTALQGPKTAPVPLLETNPVKMEIDQAGGPLVEVHSHAELQPEPVASSSAPTPPSTITAPDTKKSTDAVELSINDHPNIAAPMTTVARDDVPGDPHEVEEDAVMSCAVSEGLVSPPDIKSPDRDTAMPVNDPGMDTVAPLNDHDTGSVAPSMDDKRSSSHSRHDVATAPPEDDMSNSSGMRESSVTSEVRGHDPETAPDGSAELRCYHDDPSDLFDPSSFNMVSDSQLNDLISVMEMEDQRGPESFWAAEDATELVCGLINELSSLNRSIMAAHRELESLRRGNRTARTPQRRPLAQRRPDATPPSSSSLTGQ